MLGNLTSNFNYITSTFTRKSGFTKIESSMSISRKKAIQILNSFTPQGASPGKCIRIGSYEDYVGIGYYKMENDVMAHLKTILYHVNHERFDTFIPDIISNNIMENPINFFSLKRNYSQSSLLNLRKLFGEGGFSKILFSYLCGDNIIIVHHNHDERLRFIATLLSMTPSIVLKYNRITSDCFELDGNENIIGVGELPVKYRSHKKLYLPLDSIFVDLERGIIDGNGVKESTFTRELASITPNQYGKLFQMTRDLIARIYHSQDLSDEEESTNALINKIKIKLGILNEMSENWLADF